MTKPCKMKKKPKTRVNPKKPPHLPTPGSREGGGGGQQGGKQVLPDGRRTRTTPRAAAASEARVEWARSCVSDWKWERGMWPRLCKEAAGRGDLEMLKWLRAKGYPWDANACAKAAGDGHL